MGTISMIGLLATEGRIKYCTSVVVSKPEITLYSGHKRIWNSYGKHTDVGSKGWITTSF